MLVTGSQPGKRSRNRGRVVTPCQRRLARIGTVFPHWSGASSQRFHSLRHPRLSALSSKPVMVPRRVSSSSSASSRSSPRISERGGLSGVFDPTCRSTSLRASAISVEVNASSTLPPGRPIFRMRMLSRSGPLPSGGLSDGTRNLNPALRRVC